MAEPLYLNVAPLSLVSRSQLIIDSRLRPDAAIFIFVIVFTIIFIIVVGLQLLRRFLCLVPGERRGHQIRQQETHRAEQEGPV